MIDYHNEAKWDGEYETQDQAPIDKSMMLLWWHLLL
jgi:hypothetical protein